MHLKTYLLSIVLVLFLACDQPKKTAKLSAVETFEELQPVFNKKTDSVYVVNFWATWCKPCVEELPDIEKINNDYRDKKVKVLLVSLDDLKTLDTKVRPFVKNNAILSEVILLDDPYTSTWIPKVDPHWDGAIPATLVYSKEKRYFFPKKITYDVLQRHIDELL